MKYPRDYIRPPYVQISLRTRLNMQDREFGLRLADILWTPETGYSPTKITLDYEKGTLCESIDHFLDNWCVMNTRVYDGIDYDFPKKLWWKNKSSLRCDGSFGHKYVTTTGSKVPGHLNVTFAYRNRIDWKEMFLSLCDLMQPQLAMMHLFTHETCPPNKREGDFQCGIFGGLYSPRIPGLGWMFAGGDEFYKPIADFDLPGPDIERTDFGTYCLLEIAKSAEEIVNDLETFGARRDRLRETFPLPIVENFDSLLD